MERYVNCSGLIYHGQEPRTTTIDKPRFKSLLCWVSHRSKEIVYIPSCARISLLSTSQTFIFLLFVSLSFRFFSFDYCITCSSIYVFSLPLWYLHLLTIVLPDLLFTSSHYPFGIFIF
jgi:hypothetical protein